MMNESAGEPLREDGVGQLLRTQHRLKARKGDVRGDEEDRKRERDADGRGQVFAAGAQNPAKQPDR